MSWGRHTVYSTSFLPNVPLRCLTLDEYLPRVDAHYRDCVQELIEQVAPLHAIYVTSDVSWSDGNAWACEDTLGVPEVTGTVDLSTLLHELAHVHLGHCGKKEWVWRGKEQVCEQARKERMEREYRQDELAAWQQALDWMMQYGHWCANARLHAQACLMTYGLTRRNLHLHAGVE